MRTGLNGKHKWDALPLFGGASLGSGSLSYFGRVLWGIRGSLILCVIVEQSADGV